MERPECGRTEVRVDRLEDLKYRVDGWLMDGANRGRVYGHLRRRHPLTCTRETEIVIEGYPRSANTYAWAAFWISNGRRIRVAHHNHAAVSVKLGVKLGIPVVVLVRDPVDAVSSWLLRRPRLSAAAAIHSYVRFYSSVARVIDRVVVAPFETVVTDFGAVTVEVNERFGTDYTPYVRSPANEARIRHEVEWWDFVESGHVAVREDTVCRPSESRRLRSGEVEARVTAEEALLRRARSLYELVHAEGVMATGVRTTGAQVDTATHAA
jgi:hypothetical protein